MGTALGLTVGTTVGDAVGTALGDTVGPTLGLAVGDAVGADVAVFVGNIIVKANKANFHQAGLLCACLQLPDLTFANKRNMYSIAKISN